MSLEELGQRVGVEALKGQQIVPGCSDDRCIDFVSCARYQRDARVSALKLASQRHQLTDRSLIDILTIVNDDPAMFKIMNRHLVGNRLALRTPWRRAATPMYTG